MQSITYQLILMITIYVLLGCIVYLLAQKENEDELTMVNNYSTYSVV